jgi:DNA-binding transcriptional MerR regulator
MASYKVSDLAKLLNVKPQTINTWGQRGKILIRNGKVNMENPQNKEFVKTKLSEAEIKKQINDASERSSPPILENSCEKKQEAQKIESEPETGNTTTTQVSLAQKTMLLKAEKTSKENKLLDLKIAELENKLVDVAVVNRYNAEVISRYQITINQQIDELIRDICNENEIVNEKKTAYLSRLTTITNEASKRANEEARIAVENAFKS